MADAHGGRDLEALRVEIARVAHGFERERIEPLGEGMDSFAVLVGGAFVFRFAKHAEAALGLRREIALLPHLAPKLNLDIPRYEYVAEHSVTGLPFVGYGLIRGEPLHRPVYDGLADVTRNGVLDELATFLKFLHVFSVLEATACGVVPDDGRAGYFEDLRRARAEVFPRLDDAVRHDVELQLAAFLDNDRNFDFPSALLHGDLWPEHVLFSQAAGCLAGVIDFGDVSIGDPDYDLAFLAQRLGPRFIEGLLRRYEHADPARLAEKIRCFILFNAVEDAFSGLDRGDRGLVDSALAELTEQSKADF